MKADGARCRLQQRSFSMHVNGLRFLSQLNVEADLIADPKRDSRLFMIPNEQAILSGRKAEQMVLALAVSRNLGALVGSLLLSNDSDVFDRCTRRVLHRTEQFRLTGLCPEKQKA